MDALATNALAIGLKFAPLAVIFGLLALATKRRAIGEALRRSRKESETNLALLLLNYVILASFFGSAAGWWAKDLVISQSLADFWRDAPSILVVAVTLLLGEFIIYWRHRLEHIPLLWPVHAVHHSDEAMTWLALVRKHPLAYILALIIDSTPLLMLGLPVWAIGAITIFRGLWGHFIHADVPWTLGPLGKWIISPAAHRYHHIDDYELCGSNFGGILTLWDRVFGTYVDPSAHLDCVTGVDGGSRGFIGEVARPFEAWAGSRAVDAPKETVEA